MEQKKLLLIAISVGVFFVIVIGTALVFLKPAADMVSAGNPQYHQFILPRAEALGSTQAETADNFIHRVPGLEPADNEYWPVEEETTITADGLLEDSSTAFDFYSDDNSARTLITVDPKSAAGVPNAPVPQRTASTAPTRPAESKPAAAPAASASTAPAPAAPANTASRAPARTRDDYWVQTGAFTVLSRAENVKQTLADKGITSIIENRNVGDTLYFRVRIGPYTSQNEADYWLNLIKSINGFEDSQIRKTQTVL